MHRETFPLVIRVCRCCTSLKPLADRIPVLFHGVKQIPGIYVCLQAIVVVPDLQQGCLLCPVLVTLLSPSSFDLLLTCHNPSQAPGKKKNE